MKKLELIDWESLNERVMGMRLEDAVKTVFEELVVKMNELVEAYNEPAEI